MEKVDTIALSLTDMVFEHRNKSYGAYQLRKIYDKYLQRATIIGVTAFGLILAMLWNAFAYSPTNDRKIDVEATLTTVEPPPQTDVITPPPPPPPVVKHQYASVDLREMQVVSPDEAAPNESLTHIDEIGDREISNVTRDGDTPPGDLMVDPNATNTSVGELIDKPENIIFTKVEQMPEFPGGEKELFSFLSKNLRFPASAQAKGVSGIVFVSFVINTMGEVTDVQLAKGIDSDCDKEALRVIGKMPKWKPGRQNGQSVSVRFTVPLRFALSQQ